MFVLVNPKSVWWNILTLSIYMRCMVYVGTINGDAGILFTRRFKYRVPMV